MIKREKETQKNATLYNVKNIFKELGTLIGLEIKEKNTRIVRNNTLTF